MQFGGVHMAIKNVRVWVAGILAFALITGLHSCEDYKLKQEEKSGNMIDHKIEQIDFEDMYTPAEENIIDSYIGSQKK